MAKTGNIVTLIPSRKGSNRVPMKGMRLLGDKALIEHTIEAVKGSEFLSNTIFINSDAEEWKGLAAQHEIGFYLRKPELATSQSMIDDYLFDFMESNPDVDYLAVITPTAPFVKSEDLDSAWKAYSEGSANTLISAEPIQTHCFFKGSSLNFSTEGHLPRTQDLEPIHALNFSIAIYDCKFFKNFYKENGFAVLGGEINTFFLEGFAAIDIDEEKDFLLAEIALEYNAGKKSSAPRYSKFVNQIIEENQETRN